MAPILNPRIPFPNIGKSLQHLSTELKFSLPVPEKNEIADSLTPLIIEAIQAKDIKLDDTEIDRITDLVRRGVTFQTPVIPGDIAQVSGNVAGSLTVDW